MKKLLLGLFIFLFFSLSSNSAFAWENNLRNLFLKNKAVILVVNPRTMGAKDLNGNDIIEFNLKEESGNFVNAISRLDTIKKQGFNTLHILPVTPVGSRKALGTAGSLYALNGFDSINPQLDDKTNKLTPYQEFRNFVKECHKRGIHVIVDLPSCGSYDLYLTNPELFLIDENQKPIMPSDWVDVRVFKAKNSNGSLNQELMSYHKKFIDMMISLEVDGLRADVATIKPYEFWKELIRYTRDKSPEFLFLAEASQKWSTPACKQCEFTPYDKLLDAGFDGYYGGYVEYNNFKNVGELKNEINILKKVSQRTKTQKAVIGSFATHDILSPVVTGGREYASQILWLSVILPVNMYFVDGFQSLDPYVYAYSNQKANKSFTDDDYYYVHKGKIDIFNFSRRPIGKSRDFLNEFLIAQKIHLMLDDLPLLGSFDILRTNNPSAWAFIREYNKVKVITILNKSNKPLTDISVHVSGISNDETIFPACITSIPKIEKSRIQTNLIPYEIQMLVWMPTSKTDKK